MATIAQIDANRLNAQSSTGPVTEAGKAASSLNALTLGLYTRTDYVEPHERGLYKEFCETMYAELSPESLLEQSLAAEITGATWRLRRCAAAEGNLADYAAQDPMLDDATEKTRRSIERARSTAHGLLHRSINQLRRLQTERACRFVLDAVGDDAGLIDYTRATRALIDRERSKQEALKTQNLDLASLERAARSAAPAPDQLASFCQPPVPASPPVSPRPEPAPDVQPELASNCKPAPPTPRNSLCPCRSGQKYKRCCGRNAPPVLTTRAA
jgi:hypothetical protein